MIDWSSCFQLVIVRLSNSQINPEVKNLVSKGLNHSQTGGRRRAANTWTLSLLEHPVLFEGMLELLSLKARHPKYIEDHSESLIGWEEVVRIVTLSILIPSYLTETQAPPGRTFKPQVVVF